MIAITIIKSPAGCRKCTETQAAVEEAIASSQVEATVRLLDVTSDEAAGYGIVMTPTTVVGEVIVASGKVPVSGKLAEYLRKVAGDQTGSA